MTEVIDTLINKNILISLEIPSIFYDKKKKYYEKSDHEKRLKF